jgi:molybdate transport system ATP-binding protein
MALRMTTTGQPAILQPLAATLQRRFGADFDLDVAFTLQPGINVLFGPSGSGKTCILQLLAGIDRPDSGRIVLGDRALFDSSRGLDLPPQQRRVGYVFQHLALFPHLTAAQNVMYGLVHLPEAARQEHARMLLEETFGIPHLAARRASKLSGGEKQRVALARALAPEPHFLLLDEPLSALDLATKSRILEELLSWAAKHPIPILYVTHDREEIFSAAQHILVLENGKVIAEGAPDATLLNPGTLQVARSAVFENIFRARVLSLDQSSGTMACDIGDVVLDCPLPQPPPKSEVNIAFRAGDILLAVEEPRGISARNILPGTISKLTRREHVVAVDIRLGSHTERHVTVTSHVTPHAVESLKLGIGSEVWAILKTHSCHILRD